MILANPSNQPADNQRLLHSRYSSLASNTIDYWMLPDDLGMTEERINSAIRTAPVFSRIDFADLRGMSRFAPSAAGFCAFSGGNALDFKQAERYTRLVIDQTRHLLDQTRIKGQTVKSINVGGGSPDLVGPHIADMLQSLRELPGVSDQTEISVEFTLSTVSQEFIEELVRYDVTKVSFGVQSLDPNVRRYMRQPKSVHHLETVLNWIDGRIPVVNADLITGMPGQSLGIVISDLHALMNEPRITAISSYLLTPGAAPALLAALANGDIPAMPAHHEQALMRLHTYATFLRKGWIRRGTNTYLDPDRIPADVIAKIAGNRMYRRQSLRGFPDRRRSPRRFHSCPARGSKTTLISANGPRQLIKAVTRFIYASARMRNSETRRCGYFRFAGRACRMPDCANWLPPMR